ncbi:MAG: SH3 domain-containing C40 family peptidase [Oscillospiraceae bacterium]
MRLTAKLFRIGLIAAALCALCVISAFAVYGGGTVNADALRLRTFADGDSTILATAPKDAAVVVLEDAVDGWFKVDYKTLVGFMSAEYLNVTPVMDAPLGWGVVDTDGDPLNFRADVGTSSALLGSIPAYTALELVGVNNGWYKITYDGKTGFVSADYIRLSKDETGARNDGKGLEARSKKAAEEAASTLGAKAVAIAKQQIGKPYVSGAKGPNAFDCSGFVYYVYKQLGYNLAGGSSTQFRTYGTPVNSMNELQPGDLFFICNPAYSGGNITSHVGIYIGGGQFIHASTVGGTVTTDSIYTSWYGGYFVGGRRIG